jgi:hypothetical protein
MIAIGSQISGRDTALQILASRNRPERPAAANDSGTIGVAGPPAGPTPVSSAELWGWRANPTNSNALDFLTSPVFSASSVPVYQGLIDAFSDKTLQAHFSSEFQKGMSFSYPDGAGMNADNARTNALVDVVMAHREAFPSEEFTITTTYPGGAWSETTIPSASAASIFEREVAEKQADYDAGAAAKGARPDRATAKLGALEQAVRTLIGNGLDTAVEGITDAKAAYALLTQKRFFDEQDGTSDSREGTSRYR